MEQSRILIVDDNPEIREVVTVLLEGEGFCLEEAADGREALEKIKRNRYDLVLLDIFYIVVVFFFQFFFYSFFLLFFLFFFFFFVLLFFFFL